MKKTIILALMMIFVLSLVSPGAVASNGSKGSIVKIGQDIVVHEGEVIVGSVVAVGGNIIIHGQVHGSAVSVFGTTTISPTGRVLGEMVSVDPRSGVRVGSTRGNTQVITSNNFPWIEQNIDSGFRMNFGPNRNHYFFNNQFLPFFAGGGKLLIGILMAILVVAALPIPVARVESNIRSKPGQAILVGLLTALVVAIVGFFLVITLIGIPLAVALGIASWAAKQLGYAAIAMIVGSALLKGSDQQKLATAAIGALLVGVITLVPLAGWLAGIVLGWAALGGAINTRFGTQEVI